MIRVWFTDQMNVICLIWYLTSHYQWWSKSGSPFKWMWSASSNCSCYLSSPMKKPHRLSESFIQNPNLPVLCFIMWQKHVSHSLGFHWVSVATFWSAEVLISLQYSNFQFQLFLVYKCNFQFQLFLVYKMQLAVPTFSNTMVTWKFSRGFPKLLLLF